jgi:hypothetical protein
LRAFIFRGFKIFLKHVLLIKCCRDTTFAEQRTKQRTEQMSTMIRNAASWFDRTLGWFFTNGNKVSYERYDSSVEQDY